MDDLEKSKSKRAVIRQLVTKLINKIDKLLLVNDSESFDNLHDSLNQLLDKNETLKALDLEIESHLIESDEFENEIIQSQDYQDRVVIYKGKIERYFNKFQAIRSNQDRDSSSSNNRSESSIRLSENSSHATNVVKLPKLEIIKFCGDACNWNNFWNSYDIAIHSNDSLSKIEKFNYLKMYLGGIALSAISGFSLTEINYDNCIQLLTERFGRQDLIISSHMNKLLSINSVKNSSDVKSLRKFYDECEIHLRSLKSLNVTSGSYGNLLCPVILQKLPEDLNLEYNRKRKSNTDFDIDELIQYLRKEVECREASLVLSNSSRKIDNNFETHERAESQNKHKYNRKFSSASALVAPSNNIFCVFCNSRNHETKNCCLSVDKKKQALKDKFRCFRCLKRNHSSNKCWSKNVCKLCKKPHNDLICDRLEMNNESKNNDNLTSVSASCVSKRKQNETIYLQTALAYLIYGNKKKLVRILYDSGSHRSFIKRSTCNEMHLETMQTEQLQVFGFGEKNPKGCFYDLVEINLQNRSDEKINISIDAFIVEKITFGRIAPPSQGMRQLAWEKNIFLSDTGEIADIDILIGADFLIDVLFEKSVRLDKRIIATESLFGFVVNGKCINECKEMSKIVNNTVISEINYSLFWELEGLGINESCEEKSDNKSELLSRFISDLQFEYDMYNVRLLWKPETKQLLNNNFELASERFEKLKRRFRNNSQFFEEYKKVINEYEKEGIIEKVKNDVPPPNNVQCYLPHRAVIRNDRVTSKLRVVFDGSAHRKGELSLNDCLYIGPNLYPDLFELILAFRENKIAIVADIKQAFLTLGLNIEDRDVTRFLWSDDPWNDSFDIYRFCRVIFGINCSPFLLAATIKEHIKKYIKSKPLAYNVLNESVYVDDVISGSNNIETAFQISSDCVEIFKDAGMELRKFQTNNKELRELWMRSGINIQDKNDVIGQSGLPFKVLGVCWDPEKDVFYFDSKNLLKLIDKGHITKRFVLKIVGRIFDPVGFLGPFTILLKILIQNIWKSGLDWDQKLPIDLENQWHNICEQFTELDKLTIPRYYFSGIDINEIKSYQIHIFSDASLKGYGTVAYLRVETHNQNISTSFVSAKSRVAPLKTITLPRLELLGALLSVRLYRSIVRSLKQSCEIFFWCDSSIVCCWIKTPSINFKQFIRNRVKEIQETTDPENWNHCPGKDNPADLISRGASVNTLIHSDVWYKGPNWLSLPSHMWPETELTKSNDEQQEYRKISVMECISDLPSEKEMNFIDISKFSKLEKIVRIVAWMKRFISCLRKNKPDSSSLTSEEVNEAELNVIRLIQGTFFHKEVEALKTNLPISPKSSIYKLAPYLDEKVLLRITGRLQESDFLFDEKKPIIIPRNSEFAKLLIKQEHEKTFHSGVESTLVQLRKRFWIPKGRQLVKKVISKCLICRRYSAKPSNQMSGQLPKDRISEAPPFTVCGLDFAGPVYIKSDNENILKKSYIALFTCAVTRAIHLELVTDMSSSNFMLAFRRFLSRRGNCHTIYSDNAKTFKATDKELQRLFDIIKNSEFKDFLATKRISWKFIVALAPWWGGFYERLVKTVKEPLKKVLRKAVLNFEEMTTILTEVETIVNHRPLSYVSNEIGEPQPLTPSQFLIQRNSKVEYPAHFIEVLHKESTKKTLVKRKEYQAKLLYSLWKRWKELYLFNLRSAYSMTSPNPKKGLKVGDVVILEGTSKSKLLWELGVLKQIYQGRDGLVRSCLIRTTKGEYKRPIQLIYPLELTEN